MEAYLAAYGIFSPQIFPCAAETAFHVLTDPGGTAVTSVPLEEHAPLSRKAQKELAQRLEQAKKEGDTKEQALIHCGIRPIEAAIAEFARGHRGKGRESTDPDPEKFDTAMLSLSQIAPLNPITRERMETRREYLDRLRACLRAGGFAQRKYVSAELSAYETMILSPEPDGGDSGIGIGGYGYFLLLDAVHILGYRIGGEDKDRIGQMRDQLLSDFRGTIDERLAEKMLHAFQKKDIGKKLQALLKSGDLTEEAGYLQMIQKNIRFLETRPVRVMVTATMSAGKSTFINALTGKYICLSQNLACTGKIHHIVSKAFEDGYSYEYDHDLVLTAGREELLNDNARNTSDQIVVGTAFSGQLRGQRLIVSDSPGVNYSGEPEHRRITERLLQSPDVDLLVYLMNAT